MKLCRRCHETWCTDSSVCKTDAFISAECIWCNKYIEAGFDCNHYDFRSYFKAYPDKLKEHEVRYMRSLSTE